MPQSLAFSEGRRNPTPTPTEHPTRVRKSGSQDRHDARGREKTGGSSSEGLQRGCTCGGAGQLSSRWERHRGGRGRGGGIGLGGGVRAAGTQDRGHQDGSFDLATRGGAAGRDVPPGRLSRRGAGDPCDARRLRGARAARRRQGSWVGSCGRERSCARERSMTCHGAMKPS